MTRKINKETLTSAILKAFNKASGSNCEIYAEGFELGKLIEETDEVIIPTAFTLKVKPDGEDKIKRLRGDVDGEGNFDFCVPTNSSYRIVEGTIGIE